MDSKQKASPKRVRCTTRQAEAMHFRVKGLSYEKIGEQMGITMQAAHKLVQHGLSATRIQLAEDVESVREVELQRLDLAIAVVMEHLEAKDVTATAHLVKLQERRAKLLGLDAPDKYEHAGPGGTPMASPVILIPGRVEEPTDEQAENGG